VAGSALNLRGWSIVIAWLAFMPNWESVRRLADELAAEWTLTLCCSIPASNAFAIGMQLRS
jgi:hypothetical protein